MNNKNFYVTPAEFMEHLEVALRDTYFQGDQWDESKWHPEDIAVNMTVVIESIAAYLGSAIRMEARRERGQSRPPTVKHVEGEPE